MEKRIKVLFQQSKEDNKEAFSNLLMYAIYLYDLEPQLFKEIVNNNVNTEEKYMDQTDIPLDELRQLISSFTDSDTLDDRIEKMQSGQTKLKEYFSLPSSNPKANPDQTRIELIEQIMEQATEQNDQALCFISLADIIYKSKQDIELSEQTLSKLTCLPKDVLRAKTGKFKATDKKVELLDLALALQAIIISNGKVIRAWNILSYRIRGDDIQIDLTPVNQFISGFDLVKDRQKQIALCIRQAIIASKGKMPAHGITLESS